MATYNKFKSTKIYGNLYNSDYADGSVIANAQFDRDLTVLQNLYLGTEQTDISGNIVDSYGNIKVKINGIQYTITPSNLIQLNNSIATQSWTTTAINTAISSLISNSPSTLDTLNELATALGNDPNFATTVSNNIATKGGLTSNNTWSGTNIFNDNITLLAGKTFNNITTAQLSYLDATSSIQTQLNSKQNTLNYDTTPISGSSNLLTSGSMYTTLSNYVLKGAMLSNLNVGYNSYRYLEINTGTNATFLDFHSNDSGTAITDYDTRIISYNGNSTAGGGSLSYIATSHTFNGNIKVPDIQTTGTNPITSLNTIIASIPATYQTISGMSAYQPLLTYDTVPTSGSNKMLTSGSLYTALSTYQPTLTYDTAPTSGSTKLLTSGNIYTALQSYPTSSGTNTFSGVNTFNSNTFLSTTVVNNSNNYALFGVNMTPTSGDIFNVYDKVKNRYLFFNNESKFGLYSSPLNTTLWQIDLSGNAAFNNVSFTTLNGISSSTVNYINSLTSNAQSQLNTISSNVATIQSKQITDEANIATLQTQMITANSNITSLQNVNSAYGMDTTNKNINVNVYNNGVKINSDGSMFSIINKNLSDPNNFALYQGSSGDTVLNTGSNTALEFKVGNSEKMRINSNGNVGINTTSPNYTLDVNGSINCTTLNCPSFNTYSNTLNSITHASKTMGTNVLTCTIVTNPSYNKTINVFSPISVYRQFHNNAVIPGQFNNITETLSSITYAIYKNGSLFTSGICVSTETLPKSITAFINYTSTTDLNYEVFMTMAKCTFTPSVETVTSTYTIYLTPNYSSTINASGSNFTNVSNGYNFNTNVSSTSGTPITFNSGSYGTSFSSPYYNVVFSGNYNSTLGELQTNQITTNSINNRDNITTFDFTTTMLSTGSITLGGLLMPKLVSTRYVVGTIAGNTSVSVSNINLGFTFSAAPVVTVTSCNGNYGECVCYMALVSSNNMIDTLWCRNTQGNVVTGLIVNIIAVGF